MSRAVCPQCGSPITSEGKFCSYCGAKIPDDVFRAEIRIDDTAEIQRAQYETEESKLRQKQTEREFKVRKVRWILVAVFFGISVVLLALGLLFNTGELAFFSALTLSCSIFFAGYVVYVNLFRK